MTFDKSNWQPATFGDVCRNVNDNERDPLRAGIDRYVGLENLEPENLHIRNWGNIADGTTFTKVFRPGHVLFGKRRAYQKKAALADFTGLCSGDILVLEPNTSKIDPRFFPFLASSDRFFDFAVQTSAGSLSPRTKFQDLAQFQFLLPPKDQQARLAELLWAGDAVVETKIQLLSKSTGLYKKALDDIMVQKEKHSANLIYDKILGAHIPKKLEFIRLENILTDICYGSSVKSNILGKGFPMLRIPNVVDEKLNLDDLVYADLTENEFRNTRLNEGDILIVRTNGNPSYVGRSAIFNLQDPYVFASYLIKISVDRTQYNPDFVTRFLQTSFVRKYFKKKATSSAGNYNINTKTIKSIPIPNLPLITQDEISSKLKEMEFVTTKIQSQINLDKRLTQNILHQIFTS